MSTALRERLAARARLNALIREFFAARQVLEVETPVLSQAGNTDPNIESFVSEYRGPRAGAAPARWLRTSPEFFHKRLLAAGAGDIYELGKVFRQGEFGARHNPEFTLLEWYRLGWDERQLADEVVALLQTAAESFGRPIKAVKRLSYRHWFLRDAGVDPWRADRQALLHALGDVLFSDEGLSRDDLLDLLRTHVLEPRLAADEVLVVDAFPPSQAALARLRGAGEEAVAARFEVYLGRQELANGYHELTDAAEQAARFERDLAVRQAAGKTQPRVDQALLAALARGLPDCAGVALGVDRLLAWLGASDSIASTLSFHFGEA